MPGKMSGEWQVSIETASSMLVKNNEIFWVYQSQPNMYKINQAISRFFFKGPPPLPRILRAGQSNLLPTLSLVAHVHFVMEKVLSEAQMILLQPIQQFKSNLKVFEPIIAAITGKIILQILLQMNEGFILCTHCNVLWLYWFSDVFLASSYLFITQRHGRDKNGKIQTCACELCTTA